MAQSTRSFGWVLALGLWGCTGGGEVTSQTTLGNRASTGSTSGSTSSNGHAASTGAAAGANGSTGASSTGTTGTSSGVGSDGSTGAGATTGQHGSTGTVATGTTTGGTCPANMPDINTGVTQHPQACTNGELGSTCPSGFTCVGGQCLLNGANSGVQVTLSFDDDEDLDLHVTEPGGCEIWWGNPGDVELPDGGVAQHTPVCEPAGWLDRDSNAGCTNQSLDGIDIENAFYPTGQTPPSGTYTVKLDYWKDCDNKSSSSYGIQVRANGVTNVYCGSVARGSADKGNRGSGKLITTFTLP